MEDIAITSSRVCAFLGSSYPWRRVQEQEIAENRAQQGQGRHNRQHYWRRIRHLGPFSSHRVNLSGLQLLPASMRDEACSTLLVLFAFWIFACMTVILGFYGPSTIQFGPNSSLLIKANPFFVQSIQVKEMHESAPGSMIYGFTELPPLDVNVTWSEVHDAFIESNDHKEWLFFLNQGSKIRISYIVKCPSSAALPLVITEGSESLAEWIENPSYTNTTLSWNIIHGNGTIEQEIQKSAAFYIAVTNFNLEEVEVLLNYTITSIMYNTSQAHYMCSLSHSVCTLTLSLFGPTAGVLTSPGPVRGIPNYKWYAQISYGQRWISYLVGSVSTSVLVLVVLQLLKMYQISREHGEGPVSGRIVTGRSPLLAPDEDDFSSCDSANDSISHDEEDMTQPLGGSLLDGQPGEEEESNNDRRRLCVMCLDELRNCFFLPCGHCAACFTCGTRTIEEVGNCPICHRTVKKVQKIFSV